MVTVMVACVVVGYGILIAGKITVKYRAKRKDAEEETSLVA
jgi:hypothetical protein